LDKVCHLTGLGHLLEDPEFAPAKRYGNRHIFYPMFRDAFKSQPSTYWTAKAKEMDLTLVRMHHFSDIAEDEQAWANGYIEHVEFPTGNVDVMPASPIEMNSADVPPTVPAAGVGAHTEEILQSLGYTPEEIRQMIESGAAVG
jgi:crotonobetainyl-CoA:carnitine CoA-transferase CaiB-like acyl-CoA transferase